MLRAALFALAILTSGPSLAQDQQVGSGMVCDTVEQIQEALAFKGEAEAAVAAVNAKHGPHVCGLIAIVFLAGDVVANGNDKDGNGYEVLRILVLAANIDGKMVGLRPPITQYISRLIEEVKA